MFFIICNQYVNNAKVMLPKNAKRKISYKIGDFVRIGILKIDRSGTDRKLLIYKEIGTVNERLYRLGYKSGILKYSYHATELMPTKATDFPELREIPNIFISLREAALCQSQGEMTDYQCNCKGSCRKPGFYVVHDVMVISNNACENRNK
ncbi:hypothetical protein G9A89_005119 [Geosiphon pyriformis]|nr:hypothetical protein G9A89_005119 [Geosiphon pyriformis]